MLKENELRFVHAPSFLIDNEYYKGMLMLGGFGRISTEPKCYTEILPETTRVLPE